MKISDVMSTDVKVIPSTATLVEAAEKMAELDCGFLPISDTLNEKLEGVITDRDIVIKAVKRGCDLHKTTVGEIKSDHIYYCYEGEDIESAIQSMHDQQVYRLVVLDTPESKRLRGIISLGDISRTHDDHCRDLTGYATEGLKEAYNQF